AEAFRSLRSSIQFSAMDRPVRSILITSPGPGEGKSTVAANLAVVMAQAGMRVLLMDCDLRRPAIYKMFDRNNKMGLTNVILKDSIYWDVAPQTTDVTNLLVITSGPLPPNPSELLGSERMAHLATFYRDTFDLLIVDGPPLLSVTDASILSRLVDGVVMVVEAGQTHEAAARLACGQLTQAGARLLGFVMNKIPVGRNGYYYYHYYGYYGYDTKPKSSWTDNLHPSRWRERPVGEEVKAIPGNGSGPMLEQPVEVEVKE
nr:CpsD/CapB family tyrosine-protein kinase [Chloroflexota bacterium]